MTREWKLITSMLAAFAVAVGCSDDSESGSYAGDGTGDDGNGGIIDDGAGDDGSGGGTDGNGGDTDGSGTTNPPADDAGTPTADGPAAAFCADFQATCGWSEELFVDGEECAAKYDAWAEARQGCIEQHLELAATEGTDPHCNHAAGAAPCDNASLFCGAFEQTCEFGEDTYADAEDCSTKFNNWTPERQACIAQHLELAATMGTDPHCGHAAGDAPCDDASLFCAGFDETCGFSEDTYADAEDCSTKFNNWTQARQACIAEHLNLAATMGTDPHCGHAAGDAPCDDASLFCAGFEETCGFGDGGDQFSDADDCKAEFEGWGAERQSCVIEHLEFAATDGTDPHCGHATGKAPCN